MTEHYVILFNSHCSKHFTHSHSFRLLSDESTVTCPKTLSQEGAKARLTTSLCPHHWPLCLPGHQILNGDITCQTHVRLQ